VEVESPERKRQFLKGTPKEIASSLAQITIEHM
jgi:hypothetical protein